MSEFSIPPEFDFGQQFDRPTLTRAMALEPERAVLAMRIDGRALVTRLRGSGTQAYEQRIELPVDRRLGLQVRGRCSCPVGMNCKHVAAALMAFEAFQIRREKNPALSLPGAGAPADDALPPLPEDAPSSAPSDRLSAAHEAWLAEFEHLAVTGDPAPAPPAAPSPAGKSGEQQLVYLLEVVGTRLDVRLAVAALRRDGDVSSLRRHLGPPADLLRHPPGYLEEADYALLAALVGLPAGAFAAQWRLYGRRATRLLAALVATRRAVLAGSPDAPGPALPLRPLEASDEPVKVGLGWRLGPDGEWHTVWHMTGDADRLDDDADVDAPGTPCRLVRLPEAHAIDERGARVHPVDETGDHAALPEALADWLTRLPGVAPEALPRLVERLEAASEARRVPLPLPASHAREVRSHGALPLEPVLRLTSCPDVASELLLPEGPRGGLARRAAARQGAAELRFRYRPPGGPPTDFHFPAGAAEAALVAASGTAWARFDRDAAGEADAVQALVGTLELRPWSRAAGWALDRLTRLRAGRAGSSALPAAMEDQPMLWVPRQADRWVGLLARQVPALEAAGWTVERLDDFPYDTVSVDDDWQVDVAEAAGGDWFDIGVTVRVGGEPVALAPLLVALVQGGWLAAQAGTPTDVPGEMLVPWPEVGAPAGAGPRQRLLRLPRERIAPLLDWLRSTLRPGDRRPALRVSRFDVATVEALGQTGRLHAPPAFVELAEQVRLLQGGGLPAVAVPAGVRATLRPYQLDGLAWMDFMRRARLGGVLADDMGLGKTLQTLALLVGEVESGRADRPSLVVVPTSLIGNWRAEAARFAPGLELLVLHGPDRGRAHERIATAHVVVTSYPIAVRDAEVLRAQPWHCLVLDEAQRIKNSRSQAALSMKQLGARHRLCLSGTPLENHLGELWSLLDFVCPGLLATEAQFREQYRQPIERLRDAGAAQRLARRVRPFILRRTKEQVARELPEKTETLLQVQLGGAQADLYETVRATMDRQLRDAIARQGLARSRIMVLDALLKLRQVCCDPRLLKGAAPVGGGAADAPAPAPAPAPASPSRAAPSAKLELLLELLPTLVEDGRRILLFSQFTEMLSLIEPELVRLRLPYLKLTGETVDRAGTVARFQGGEAPLFLVSLKAGGVGLNLTAADTVILFDPWWNPAVEQQAIDRAYRIGQDKPVFVYKLVAAGTVEEKMLELQARKAGLADLLLSGVAGDAGLGAEDFEALFQPLGGA